MDFMKTNQDFDFRDVLIMRYSHNYETNKELLTEAFCYFRYFFEINEKTGTYACGSLKRLEKIIGKDYFSSDLLIAITDDFEEEYLPVLDHDIELAWQRSIINVIGGEAWEAAFKNAITENVENTIIDFVYENNNYFEFNCNADGENEILELMNENYNIHNAICFAIVEYFEEEGLEIMSILPYIDSPDDYFYDIVSIIDSICFRWYNLTEIVGFN